MLTEEELGLRVSELLSSSTGIPSELSSALDYVRNDPATALTKARICLEAILKSTLSRHGILLPEATLGQLLGKEPIKKGWPGIIRTKMFYVEGIASAMGPHSDALADTKHAIRVLEEVCDVLEWYASSLRDNFGIQISENERLIIYVSRGGTCRCAMANVITRHYLEVWGQLAYIRPMSCSLDEPTHSEISADASAVLSKRVGVLPSTHQSIRLDQRYVLRADLI